MQKNKIDVAKAVWNIAARKLAVLGLAAAVSNSGTLASAQMPEEHANRHPQRIQSIGQPNEKTLLERICRIKIQQNKKHSQLLEIKQQLSSVESKCNEKEQQLSSVESKCNEKEQQLADAENIELLEDIWRLNEEASRLKDEGLLLATEILALSDQIVALLNQLTSEQQEEPVEEMNEIVPEDAEMKEEPEEPRENQNETMETNILQDDDYWNLLRHYIPNQRQDTRGGMFNLMRPFGSNK